MNKVSFPGDFGWWQYYLILIKQESNMTFEYNWKLILSSVLLALICRLDVIHGCSGGGETPGDGVTEAPGEYLSYVVLKRGIKKNIS